MPDLSRAPPMRAGPGPGVAAALRCLGLFAAARRLLGVDEGAAMAPPEASMPAGGARALPMAGEATRAEAGAADVSDRFREVILPHIDAAHNLARFLSRDADAAQDIVQDAFLRAYRSFAGYRGGEPRAWILAIVRNCHLDWRARRGRIASHEVEDAVVADGADGAVAPGSALVAGQETPETALVRRGEAEAVRAVLERLPDDLREVIVLRDLEELSYREIADVMGTPIGTVMSRLSRGRKLFREAWAGASRPAEGRR
jgi:RNA polymerase sigma factor (sigma-70 family)